MKRLFPLLFAVAACGTDKNESPRAEIVRQQNELKKEYKRLKDSAKGTDSKSTYGLPEMERDSIIRAEAAYNRRIFALEQKSDSLSTLMKAWQLDSIAKSR